MINQNSCSSYFKITSSAILLMSGVLTANLAQAETPETLEQGVLQVGMEVSYPPFESWENGEVVGFDAEMSKALASQMGLEASFEDTKFTSLILGLQSNKFDTVISGMYITPERTKQADAVPYAQTGALIMVTQGSEVQPETEQDLCGLEVGLQQGTTWVSALQELSSQYCEANGKEAITINEFPSAPEATQALLSRNVQAQLEIAGAAKMFVERTNGRVVISSPELVYPQTLGIYVKQGNTQLETAFKNALAALRENGQYQTLLNKYDLQPVSAE